MNANKKLCCCDDCLNKSNDKGRYVHSRTWSRHQEKKNLFEGLENDSETDSLMSMDNENTKTNDGI